MRKVKCFWLPMIVCPESCLQYTEVKESWKGSEGGKDETRNFHRGLSRQAKVPGTQSFSSPLLASWSWLDISTSKNGCMEALRSFTPAGDAKAGGDLLLPPLKLMLARRKPNHSFICQRPPRRNDANKTEARALPLKEIHTVHYRQKVYWSQNNLRNSNAFDPETIGIAPVLSAWASCPLTAANFLYTKFKCLLFFSSRCLLGRVATPCYNGL